MKSLLNQRHVFLAIFFACAGLLVTAMYVEPFKSMNPCPMCIMQRAAFFALGLFALIGAFVGRSTFALSGYTFLMTLTAGIGAGVAGRQVWLQHLPADEAPACGPGLEYMIDVFPLMEALEMALRGTGDCAEVQWTFLTLSIPGWSLIAFTVMGLAVLVLWLKQVILKK